MRNDSITNEVSQIFPFSDSLLLNEENKESDEQPKKKKVRGRPKGARNKANSKLDGDSEKQRSNEKAPRVSNTARIKSVENKPTLPKMNPNVHIIKLKPEQIEDLKKSKKTFFQPGVCYQIAPSLDQCKECVKIMRYRRVNRKQVREVDCRFYQLRKLRYTDEGLEVVGFLDPHSDPIDVDRYIWLPHSDKRVKSLSPQNARFILIHVGEQLCDLIEKEEMFYQKYKSDEQAVIWKRLIE